MARMNRRRVNWLKRQIFALANTIRSRVRCFVYEDPLQDSTGWVTPAAFFRDRFRAVAVARWRCVRFYKDGRLTG
jgi:hypothetical protein